MLRKQGATPAESSEPGRSQVRRLRIGEEGAGQRIDNFLSRELKGVPRSRIYRLVRKGEVRVNGKRVHPDHKLAAGDELRVPPVREAASQGGPRRVPSRLVETIRRAIVYEDPDLLVVIKPS